MTASVHCNFPSSTKRASAVALKAFVTEAMGRMVSGVSCVAATELGTPVAASKHHAAILDHRDSERGVFQSVSAFRA